MWHTSWCLGSLGKVGRGAWVHLYLILKKRWRQHTNPSSLLWIWIFARPQTKNSKLLRILLETTVAVKKDKQKTKKARRFDALATSVLADFASSRDGKHTLLCEYISFQLLEMREIARFVILSDIPAGRIRTERVMFPNLHPRRFSEHSALRVRYSAEHASNVGELNIVHTHRSPRGTLSRGRHMLSFWRMLKIALVGKVITSPAWRCRL